MGSEPKAMGELKKISSASQSLTQCLVQFFPMLPSSQSKPSHSDGSNFTPTVYRGNIRQVKRCEHEGSACFVSRIHAIVQEVGPVRRRVSGHRRLEVPCGQRQTSQLQPAGARRNASGGGRAD